MRLEPDSFDALVARFQRLGAADRDAVLATLTPGERDQVAVAMTRHVEARRDDLEAAKRAGHHYAAYSPWLADIVRKVVTGEQVPGAIAERARRAIGDAHTTLCGAQPGPAESLWTQLRRAGGRLLDGEPRGR